MLSTKDLSMLKSFNPYAILGAVIAVGILIGAFIRIDNLRAGYKKTAEDRQDQIVLLQAQIRGMTTTQNYQTGKTEENVIRVVVPPEKTTTIVKNIREAPAAEDCKTPVLSEETTNAF
jgi:hypothetical protein